MSINFCGAFIGWQIVLLPSNAFLKSYDISPYHIHVSLKYAHRGFVNYPLSSIHFTYMYMYISFVSTCKCVFVMRLYVAHIGIIMIHSVMIMFLQLLALPLFSDFALLLELLTTSRYGSSRMAISYKTFPDTKPLSTLWPSTRTMSWCLVVRSIYNFTKNP